MNPASSRRTSSPGVVSSNSPLRHQQQHQSSALRTTWRHSAGSADAFSSFLDMDEETDDAASRSRPASSENHAPEKQRIYETTAPSDPGVTFEELIERLIALPMSKQDAKFSAIFLCLYRKFAAPSTLLNALIARFETTEQSDLPQLTRASEQLRLLQVIAQWASEYPGDFAHPKTRQRLVDFVESIEDSHVYMFAAKEISLHLENRVEDDDLGWPFRDGEDGESSEGTGSSHLSPSTSFMHSSFSENVINNISTLDLSDDPTNDPARDSGTISTVSSTGRSVSTMTQASSAMLALENAQREAMSLELTARCVLTKIQWRQFMEIPDDDFARELTRIDWTMFTSFRPRDLVRHVSLSGSEKGSSKTLQNVNRMIQEFNHLACLVANMILLRDKAKHRAKAMEKFMNIALRLRRLNNYNSLGAVMAGINGTPVQRLAQTRELIPLSVQKDFLRLVILMSTQKSHFAYRLAWDNSFGERIPFLPLHRRDLVSAEEGNKTFVGENKDRINWKKFEIMGEVVLAIQRSQRTPYPYIQRNEEVQRLVLDAKMFDEEIENSEPNKNKMTDLPLRARQLYRALLRELPRRHISLPSSSSTTSPLKQRFRTQFERSTTSIHSIQRVEQFVQYAKAQRMYATLLARYNPGMDMDQEERVRLTARRVGMDLPVENRFDAEREKEKGGVFESTEKGEEDDDGGRK
ncbi:Ras guanyl-nucleotide exchange factor RasGEF, putative [Talaromyces stipitatus ATCC 10500]|uniref:Ras guanyl-nucleotide exchange factor RasGEF, putative n=1 Tax=Talaromyces stipitatus (strain ATCC 10500 / CBS 375.48 / QM 6759 / NRRL 1006) TaxID=441959 RepID=B8MGM3_TALSN|nr:Ras guanyl-nucleotide exchange factor RasGEF, putative [Talaromyces stipitatus ATCC 10500]EED16774.1 Ras guanyl-nucleotide exchange factor RasGEF, putative [Talaromyces stipitatus ATCC 10500]